MKRKKGKKHTIFAISINKKMCAAILAGVAVLCVGMLCAKLFDKMPKSKSTAFFELSIGLGTNREEFDLPSVNAPDVTLNDILAFGMPIFKREEKSVDIAKASAKSEVQTLNNKFKTEKPLLNLNSNKTSEKSIVSENLMITNATSHKPDVQTLVSRDVSYDAKGESPKVLIMHTHGCETYSSKFGKGLGEEGSFRTKDTTCNVTAVGEVIADKLKSAGINVIHDKTLCDYPEYNESYKVSLEVIENYLEKYPTIEFVFDIHRDAIESSDGKPTKLTCTVDGRKCAQAMIVCGTDAMLEHPNWQENLTLALKIQKQLETDYPGLMRPVNLREERFNMHKTTGSLIFEIGTHGNTLEEAKQSAEYVSEGIAKILTEKT
ncbi:MAG: stage II sporulation protein P [Clostridia bacterium]|nr:stage II sporulation protein P [Clostridia bacterium]